MLSRGDTSRDNLYKIDMGVVKPLKQTKKGGGSKIDECVIFPFYIVYDTWGD